MRTSRTNFITFLAFVLALFFTQLPSAQAATFTWTGAGTTNNFSDAANWGGTAPTGVATDALVFAGTTRLAPNNDITGGTFASIKFNAGSGAFTIAGNAFTMAAAGGINNSSTALQTISTAIAATAAMPIVMTTGGGSVTLNTGVISGTGGGFTTSGSGTLTLAGANTCTGASTVGTGTIVRVTAATGLGAAAAVVTVSAGGELAIGAAVTVANPMNLNGAGVSGSALTVSSTATLSGAMVFQTATTVSVAAGITATVSGATTATGNVTKIGTGTMLLSAAGVIATGTLTINAGTFTVNGTALWNGGNITVNTGGTMQCTGAGTNSIKDTATITVASGGIFDFNQTGTETIGGLTLNGVGSGAGAMINSTNTAGGLITGGVTLGSATTINSGTGTLQFASAFVGGFALTKIGTGTLTLRNANAATSLTILAGTFNGGGGTGTAGVNYYGTGPITLGDSANPTVAATLTLQSNNTLTFPNAIITGTNMTGLLSFLDPSGANVTWNGPITLNNSSLSITNTNGQANSIINFTGGVTGTGNLTLNGSGNGAPITFSGATVNNIGTITNAGNNLGGVVSINSVIGTNVTGITQNSVNSPLILGGNNTTTAPVTVTAGNLYVSSTGTVLGAVNVTAANLAGAGAINGAVTLAGTTPSITPGDLTLNGNTANGNTIGTLSVANNVTFSTPGALTFQLGATNDKIVVSGAGNMVFGTSGTINLAAANGFNPATTYTIVDTTTGTGTISGASTLTFTMPGYTFVTNQATATNTLTVGPFTPATNQLTWVGGNGNDMATATNWNPAKAPNDPSGPFELIFSVTNPGVLINTLPAGTRVLALTFNASGYTLTGNQLTVLANATSTLAPFGTGVAVANGFSATINAPLTLSSVTADMAVGVGSLLTISGVVSSAGIAGVQLTKSGAGALTLSGANTITNGFTMNAGTLNINNAAALSAAAVGSPIGTFTYNGGTLDNTSGSAITVTANASLVLNADVVFAGTNNLTFSGTVPLNATRNFTVNANALGLAGIISGTGFGITKLGLGTLTLGAVTNTYTGVTTINNGVLSVSTTLCLSSTTNPAIVIAGGSAAQPATLSYTGGGALSLAASRNIQLGTVSNANIIDVSNAAGTLQVDTTTFVMSGGMASPGVAFIKTGPGAFASNNGNATSLPAAFVGDIRVLNGRLTSTQSSTTVANTQLFGNGTIFLGDTTGTNSTSLNITGTLTGLFGNTMLANVNVVAGNTGTSSLVCTNTGSSYQVKGNIVMNKDLTILGPSTNTAAATIFTHAGTLTGTGILTVKNNGNTTASTESFNFNSASAFAGSFNVAVGTTGNTYITQLQLGATNSFPPTCTIALNGTGTRFNTNGFSNTVGSITGAAGSIISNNNAATASTLTIGNDNTSYTYAGTVIDGGVGVLNLATTGSGTIQFSGVNTYTGTTVVGGTGALFLNGAETTTGVHSVNTGAALGGSGSTTGTVVSSATSGIIPGTPTATGTFKTAGLTLNAASVVNFRLTGLSAGTGTLALAGNDTIDLSAQAAPAIVGTFNISGLQGLSAAPNNRYRMFVTTGAAPTVGAVTLNMPAGYTGSLVVAGLAVELIVSPSATQFTWSGGGGSGDMSVGANWVGGVAPTDATADLVFPASGANQAALINNLATAAVNSMTFTGGTYTISTGTQTSISLPASNALFTPLSVPAGTHSINTNLVFAAPTAGNGISVASGAILNLGQVGTTTITTTTLLTINSPGTTVVNSAITGVALTFPNTSTGTVTLAGSNALLTGAVTLNAGTLKTSNVGALGTTGPLTVANGATWDLAGAVGTISVPATLSGTGVGGVGVLINTVNSTPTLSATMTLGSIPTAITINNGVTTFTGNIAGGGSALALGGTGNISVNGIIDANVTTVTKTATGSVTLAGNNTYTGITTISAGVLVMGHASALGTTAAGTVISSGGALDLNGFTLSTESLTIAGVGGTSLGAIINTNATPAVVTGPITLTAASTIYNNNTGGITLGTITNATFAVTVDGGGPTNFAGVVSGTGGLVKTGTGTLTLSAVNTFTGAVTVSKGTLAMGIDNALVPTSAVTVNADATAGGNTVLDFATFGGTIASLITICDNPGNANVINVGNLTIATTLVLGRHVTAAINLNSSTLTLAAGKTINIGSGTTSVMTLGDYITLAAASGTVTSTFDASLGAGVNINVGSLLLGNSVITTGNVLLPSTLILPTSTTSSCSITASTTVQLGKTAGLGMNYSETLVFGGGVNVLTTPILLIGGSKLTTANVSIANGGTLNMVGTTSIQVADQTNAAATGTLSTCSFDMTGGTLIAPGLSTVVVGKYVGAGTGGANGTLNFGTSALTNVTMTSLSAGQETTGAQTGNTSQGTVIIGGGTVRLGTVNLGSSFTGTTVQVTGRLNINGGSVFSGNIVMGTATGTAVPSTIGQVDLNGGTLNVTGILSKGTATTATIANVNFNGGTLQAGASSATFMTGLTAATVLGGGVTIDTNGFSITITQPLVTSGSAGEALTKAGAGTLTLIGVNTYVGATTINAGVLALSGVIAGSVTAAGTSTLQGTGTIGGALSMGSGTTLSPGIGGTGTLSINANTVLNTVNLNYDLGLPGSGAVGGAFNDYVTSTGTFNLDLGATPSAITIVPQPGFGVGTYTLMSPYASVLNPTSVPTINTLPGVTMAAAVTGNALVLNVTAIATSATRVTWTGGAGDHLWSTAANWSNAPTGITSGGPYELYFPNAPTSTDFLSNDDIAALTIHSIVIESATAYTIGTTGAGTTGTLTVDGNGTNLGTAVNVISGSHAVGTAPMVWTTQNQTINVVTGGLALTNNISNGAFNTLINNGVDLTYGGILGNGTGGLLKAGSGKLTITGTNTYSGSSTIGSGTLSIAAPVNLGTGAAANSIIFPVNSFGILQLTSTQTSASKGILLSGNGTIDIPNAADTWTLSAATNVISGAGGLAKIGAGTLVMSQANTFAGAVTVNAGTFTIGNATALGPVATAALAFGPNSTGLVRLNALNVTVNALNTSSPVGTPIIENGGAAASILTVSPGALFTNSTFAGTLRNGGGAGTLALTKNGNPTLTLSGTNTQTGATTLTLGTLQCGSNTCLGGTLTALAVNAGVLDLNGFSPQSGTFSGTGAAALVTDNSAVVGTSTLNMNYTAAGTYAGLVKDGATRVVALNLTASAATLSMIFNNALSTYSGGITCNSGRINTTVSSLPAASSPPTSGPFGVGPITITSPTPDVLAGGYCYFTVAVSLGNNFFVQGRGAESNNFGVLRVDAVCTLNGTLNLTGNAYIGSNNAAGTLNILGRITDNSGNSSLNVISNASFCTVFLNNNTLASNDWHGGLNVLANGRVTLGKDDQIPNGAGFGNVSATGTGTLLLSGFQETINGLTGSGIVDGGGNCTFTIGDNDQTASFTGVIRNTAGVTNVVKLGAGVQTFGGANTYSGTTTINNGGITLSGAGTIANTAGNTITVNAGGTLTFARTDAFGVHSSAINIPIVINTGGVVTNSGAFYNSLGPVTLNGGTLSAAGGASATFPSWGLKSTVFVVGTTTSTMSAAGANAGFALGQAGATTNTVTIDVTNHNTGASPDVIISGPLVDGLDSAGTVALPSSLVISGVGEVVLSGSSTFTGGTTISGATLDINNSTALGATGSALTITTASTLNCTSVTPVVMTNNNPINLNANLTFTGTNNLTFAAGAITTNAARSITVSSGLLGLGGNIGPATNTVTKLGAGTLRLGSAANAAPISLDAGVLAGTFTTSATITMNGGTLEPGNMAGATAVASTVTSSAATPISYAVATGGLTFNCGAPGAALATPGVSDLILNNSGATTNIDFNSTTPVSIRIKTLSGFGQGVYLLADQVDFINGTVPALATNVIAGSTLNLSVVASLSGVGKSLVLTVSAQQAAVWTGLGLDGSWKNPANWRLGSTVGPLDITTIPYQLQFDAVGSGVGPNPINDIPGGVTVLALIFNSPTGYTINTGVSTFNTNTGPGGTVTVLSAGVVGGTAIGVQAGANTINGTMTLAWSTADAGIVVTGGSLIMNCAVNNGAFNTLVNNTVGNDVSMGGVIGNGFGGLTKSGAGKLTLGSAANTYLGVTTINAGTVSISSSAQLGANISPTAVTFGTGSTGALQITGVTTAAQGFALQGNAIIDIPNAANSLTFVTGSSIAGTGGLTKNGPGNLTLFGTNTYSGPTAINGGVVSISDSANLGNAAATNTLSISGATLRSTFVGNVDLTSNRTIAVGTGGVAFDTPLATNTLTISGIMTSVGTDDVYKTGLGTLIMAPTGIHTYTGNTFIIAGIVSMSISESFGSITGGYVQVEDGAQILLAGNGTANAINTGTAKQFKLKGAGPGGTSAAVLNNSGIGQNQTMQNILLLADTSIGGANQIDMRGAGTGSTLDTNGFTFKKIGAGTMNIVGTTINNTTFTKNPSILIAQGTFSLETTANVFVASGATGSIQVEPATIFYLYQAALTSPNTSPIVMNGGIFRAFNGSPLACEWAGDIIMQANSTFENSNGTVPRTFTLSGKISGPGNVNIVGSTTIGAGNVIITNMNNDYTGTTTISSGILQVPFINSVVGGSPTGPLGAQPTSAAAGTINIGSAGSTGVLCYAGPGETTDRVINQAGTTGGVQLRNNSPTNGAVNFKGDITSTGTGAKTLTLIGTSTAKNTISGVISQLVGGATTITMNSTTAGEVSKWALAGNNTFTGNVTATQSDLTIAHSNGFGIGTKTIQATNNVGGVPVLHLDGGTANGDIILPATMTITTSGGPATPPAVLISDAGNNVLNGPMSITSGNGSSSYMVNSGTLTINGNISAAATQRQLYLRGAGNGIINGIIANGTTLNLQIFKDAGNGTIGTGTWTLNGANTFTGGINVTAGTLEFGADANLGATPSTGALAGNGTSATNVVPATGTGSGYSQPAPTVTFSAPPTGGTQAVATTTLGITAANYVINANGSTYTTQPTITFAGGGGAGAAATVAAGGILTVTTAGTGYTSVPTLTFSAGAGLVGPGYSVTSTDATKFCVGSIAFSNAGAGYLTVPTVTFSTGNATLSLLVQGVANLGAGTTLQTKAAVTTARLIALAGAATVNTNGFNSSFTGNIGSTGSLTKIGSGTLALGSANTFTGGSTVNAGVLALTGDLSLGAVPATPTLNLTINGATVQNNGAVTANLNRIFAIGTGGATFNVNSASNFTIQSVIQDVAPGAGTVNVTATGAGLYVPAAQNTYTGGTHLAAGSKSVINSTSTGSATTNDLVSGPYGTGTLFMDGGQQRPTSGGPSSIGNAVQITADSTFIVGVAPTLTFTGPVTLVGGTRTLVTNSVGNIVFAGAIGDAGNNYGLTLGAGSTNTIVLAGVNTYTGTTTITAGTLQLGDGTTGRDGTIATSPSIVNNSALVYNRFGSTTYPGVISGTGTVTMTGVGTQTLSGINTYSGLTTISGGVLSIAASSGIGNASATNTIALSGGATLQSTGAAVDLGTTRSIVLGTGGGTIDVTGTNALTVSGVISGATALTKSSAGTLLLSGSNTTSGAIAVTGGTLSIGASTNLGNAAATNSLTLSNGGALQNTGASVDLGALRMVTLGTGGGTINVTGSNVLTVSGIVSGATNLTKTSSGVLTLTNTNTNTGSVVINGGIVSISASANLGDASATNTLALNNGGTLQSTGAAVDLGANRTVALGTGGGGIDINANNVLTLTAAVSGTGAATDKLIKTGTGELDLLNASNTYVGDTNVNGGTLGGTGVVTASRVFANTSGTIRPGTAATPGTFTVFHADFSGGGTLKNRVTTGQVNDKLVVTAPTTLVMGGTSKLVVDMTGFLVTDQQINYVLADTPSWSPNLAFSNSSVINNSSTLTPANGALAFPNLNYKIVTAGVSQQVLFAVGNATVTPVKITEFAARPEGAGVTLGWTCVSEYQNAGFNLYRQNMGDPEWTRINPALIAGRITNADEKKYSFCDWAEAGEYRYKLESIAIDGTRETYEHIVDAVRVDTVVASVYENEINASGIEAATATLTMVASVENTTRVAASFNVVPMTQPNSMNEPTRREMAAKVRNAPVALVNHAATSPLIAARWFSSGVSSGASNFSGVKVVYKNAGVLSIPTTMVPPGFNVGHVAIQREGRSLTALARTPSSLIVYAQGYQDDYTDKDALFLRTISGATPAGNVSMVSGLFGNGQVANTETQTSAMAEFHDVYFDYDYRPYSFAPWFSGQYLTNGTTQTFALNTPYASSGAASLTVNVWSLTSTINVPTDHALQVVINGHAVGQTQWNGGGKMVALSFQVPSNVLNAGANQVQLITPELNGVNSQICFLHSLTMSYARTTDGTQPVTVTNSGSASALYEVSNVPSAAVWVVDTRFPDRAALVPYEAQAQNDGTYTIRFNAAGGGTGKFLVVPAGSENVPVSVAKCVVKPVKASTYLAVGPAQFSAGVQPLLLKRSKEGLRTAFVDQEQIFNFYNYGRYGPDGIQKAVRSVRPQYLLLVGRTTYDYRNYTGANVDPLCPAFLVSTSFWAQTTSDSMFGDLGRGYPEVAVGRLPVNNGAELGGAVRHILSNTGAPPSGMRGHAISDIADASAGDFSAQALGITQSLPDVTWQTNFLGVTYQTSPEVTAALKSAASGGADLLVYVGHGNAARLGAFNPRILDVDSVQTWTGHAVFVQTTCTANWMAKNVSGYKSIAIQALTQPQGGISASIGTSTYMNSECASAFAEQLLKYADKSGMRWGDALMKTQQWAAAQGSGFYTDLNKTEQIFGDPAMPVFARPTPTSTGASTGSSSLTPATPVVVPGTF